ncbi:unnamed protein product [Microthlaspi erraticum]|uniref:Response regulatory domain-containing protein n=1 Tax=Microthlaspi erraticum TaxID=1685480 RepID=A0A6D2L215_9BRAS|nr:unnamed protein product [Microthlaspi erraticum]
MAEKCDHCEIPASDDGGGPSRYHPNSSDMISSKFPEGLRVLVFDEDPQYLLELEKYLQESQYEVTGCNDEKKAMFLLCNHRNRFDVAIIEAKNSDGEIFRLISEIGSELDLPIIIISKDDSVKSVINWMKNGACDYLLKPLRPEDLRLMFKYVAKKTQVRRSVAVAGEAEEKAAAEKSSSVGDSTIRNPNKRKRGIYLDGETDEDQNDHDRDSTTKKRRVVWDEHLHSKFMEAVEYLGAAKAVPKKILERMNVDGITRENVASHLQKYRLNLKKQSDHQNERDEKNVSLITQQEGGIYGEGAIDFYGGRNIQFPTHHINDIPQLSSSVQLISPLEQHHHHDGVSVAVSSRNVVMNHQHHHQASGFAIIENTEDNAVYNEDDDAGVANLTCWFTQNSEEMSLFHLQEPVMPTTILTNDNHLSANPQQMMNIHEIHEPSMLHIPSFPSSFTHSLDQQETMTMVDVSGGFDYNNGYSVNSNRLT